MVAAATAAGGSHAGVMPTVYDSRLRPQPRVGLACPRFTVKLKFSPLSRSCVPGAIRRGKAPLTAALGAPPTSRLIVLIIWRGSTIQRAGLRGATRG